MHEHVNITVSRCFGALRQLRSVRLSVPQPVFQSLVTSLVASRLDYGNAALASVTEDLKRRMQSVLNASARLIFGLSRRQHISDTPRPSLAAGLGED